MVNSKKYSNDNPRVVISTRKNVKDKLRLLYPDENTDHKRLTKLMGDKNE